METINLEKLSTSFLKGLLVLDASEIQEELKKRELVPFPYKEGSYLLSVGKDNVTTFIKVCKVAGFKVEHDTIENDPEYNSLDEYTNVEYSFDSFLRDYENIKVISEEDYNKAKALMQAYNDAIESVDSTYMKLFEQLIKDVKPV